jgi:A118 family predicted phage portal protein
VIYVNLDNYLSRKFNYNSEVKDVWVKNLILWKSWYKGKVDAFHNYTIFNGSKKISRTRLSLQMAKKACEDWADLLFNEKCTISVSDQNSNKALQDILTKNKFWKFINHCIEKSGASGTGAIVVSVHDISQNADMNVIDVSSANTKVDYIDADAMYPLSWNGRNITECAFAKSHTKLGKSYVHLTVHKLNEKGNYVIHNKVFLDNKGSLSEVEDESVIAEFDTKSTKPWFVIISPQQNNNIEEDIPWGISYYANAIDTLEAIDLDFDSLHYEVQASRKRTFVRQEAMQVNAKNGEIHETFDPNDVTLYVLPDGYNKEDLIQTEDSEIRVSALCEALDKSLAIFGEQVGFGPGRYKFDLQSMSTATEVISQNSPMFRRKKKHETGVEDALYELIDVIAYASTEFGPYNINTNGLTIGFDDSIIEDKEAISNRALREQQAGVISRAEYRMKVFGEDEETAKKKIEEIKKEDPKLEDVLAL